MYKITDITSLGTEYTISDEAGVVVGKIQIIPNDELLSATLGPYTPEFGSYDSYIEKSKAVLSGVADVDPNKVLWYATCDEEVELTEVIQYAVTYGYDKVILEHLADLD